MNAYKGRMPTKIELALEQSQQGVSNDVLKDSNYLIHSYRVVCFETFWYNIYTVKRYLRTGELGCSILDLDDAKLDVYNGPNLRSPYEYFHVDVKKPVSDVEKIAADTLFAMIGSKLDLIFESQSGIGLNHLEMETLTPTLLVSAYRNVFVQYLYYVKHPKAKAIEKTKIRRMKMSWRTTRNSTNCGVFTMLHMESYIGAEGEWKCGLAKESKNKMNN
nr:ulp1 protease family, C-terminal catalytic domain-containing protein [Tanacetum cinerariifolium]